MAEDRPADRHQRCRYACAYRDRYREGIPRRPIADEEADARTLYRVLAELGGAELVGPAGELEAGTFYRAAGGLMVLRLPSLAAFVAIWWLAALFVGDARCCRRPRCSPRSSAKRAPARCSCISA